MELVLALAIFIALVIAWFVLPAEVSKTAKVSTSSEPVSMNAAQPQM